MEVDDSQVTGGAYIRKDSSGKWQKSSINWLKQKSIGSGAQEVVNDINIINN